MEEIVSINIEDKENEVLVKISDNGVGFKMLKNLNQQEQVISNINNRLKLLYGEKI